MRKTGSRFIKSFSILVIALGLLKIAALIISGIEHILPVRTILSGLAFLTLGFGLYKTAGLFVGSVGHRKLDSNYSFWRANQRHKTSEPHPHGFSMKPRDGRNRILTLSGGGYKAGLFHLGSLQELNTQGKLNTIDAFASVSGVPLLMRGSARIGPN